MWAGFEQHIGKPMRDTELPFGFTIGNHDASSWRSPDGGYLFDWNERSRVNIGKILTMRLI
jgi:hypothetical protein